MPIEEPLNIDMEKIDLTVADISKMSREEQQNLKLQMKDITDDIEFVYKRYSKLHMMNYEDFFKDIDRNITNIRSHIKNSQFEGLRYIILKNKMTILAEQGKVPKNPFTEALKISEESIKNWIQVVVWQKEALQVAFSAMDRLLDLIDEYKSVEHDKVKSSVEKESRESFIKHQKDAYDEQIKTQKDLFNDMINRMKAHNDEMMAKMREQLEIERKHNTELVEQLKGIRHAPRVSREDMDDLSARIRELK